MLVLTRKLGEEIRIDGNITVTVLELDGGKVRLGVKAPQEVRILRGELTPFEEKPRKPARAKSVTRRRIYLPEQSRSYAGTQYAEAT